MDDVQKRLFNCFHIVFPDLPESEIPLASQARVAEWDSVASISLANVIEEEFGLEVLDQVADLDSFEKMNDYVHAHATVR
jgi:acyl carrier protein